MNDFHDRVAVVTGAGSGIGAALAAGLAGEGALVVAVDIDGDAASATAARIGHAASAACVDVTDPAAVEQLAQQVFDENGHVDIVINNAGVFQGGLMWERSL
jgi:NAD(P)-dependent dehydrogenase (short-subunit alcohol dehydrogenase family)